MIRFALPLVALLLTPGLAAANTETEPGCEADQPWIGYARTDPVREAVEREIHPTTGAFAACEGEHWDGQDSLDAEPRDCAGAFDPRPDELHLSHCLGPDPNAGGSEDPFSTGFRVSGSSSTPAAYAAAHAPLVARAAVYADGSTAALYLRDNTPGNVVVTLLTPPRPGPQPEQERDCSQARYQEAADANDTRMCPRDNTAVTVEHALLA